MNQIASLWQTLDSRRRLIVIATTIGVFVTVLVLARMAVNPSMALLYSGLDPAVSGEVVNALEQRGVTYEVKGDSIYVEASKRDRLRMSLAQQGLPATGEKGYELLDNLSGFGTTARMFDAAYWRAKEGELARTILSWPSIRSARVHIAVAKTRPFEKRSEPRASVTLRLASGSLDSAQIRALRFLVSSAVAGLKPEKVAIIDAERGLLSTSENSVGNDRKADNLRKNVERLLQARVGPGNAVVEVSIETVKDQEKLVERRLDPKNRVAISTDNREITGNATNSGAGQVTVASNLPSAGKSGGSSSRSNHNETREIVNYEVSQTTREIVKSPNKIKRMTVAVLINDIRKTGPDGKVTWQPRSSEELDGLRELVQSSIGFNKERGDVVTVRSMRFEMPPTAGTEAVQSFASRFPIDVTALIQAAILAVVALVLGLAVLRPLLSRSNVEVISTNDSDAPPLATAPSGAHPTETLPDPVSQLRQVISERQGEAIEVLKSWIESEEEPTR